MTQRLCVGGGLEYEADSRSGRLLSQPQAEHQFQATSGASTLTQWFVSALLLEPCPTADVYLEVFAFGGSGSSLPHPTSRPVSRPTMRPAAATTNSGIL